MTEERWEYGSGVGIDPSTEIAALPAGYARALDRRDWDGVRARFCADARAEGKFGSEGIDLYLPKLRAFVETYRATMHFTGTITVARTGEESALLESYAIAFHLDPVAGGTPWTVGVEYVDRVRREAAGWKIEDRRVRTLWEVDGIAVLPVG